MLNGNIRPSTIEGVKRLATQLRKSSGLKHAEALDAAAKAARCQNFKHAARVLPLRAGQDKPTLFLTVYWSDSRTFAEGRETVELGLSKPLLEICGKSQFQNVRGFGSMRLVASDHFVSDSLASSQDEARSIIGKAVRSLRFMEATGLQPSREYRKGYPDGTRDSELPDADHATDWFDPASGQFIYIDEPYAGVPDDDRREQWAKRYGWYLAKSEWAGMYAPNRCPLYVAGDSASGYDFDALVVKINAMPPPFLEREWTGISVPDLVTFVSPAATTAQDRRRAKSRGTIMAEPSAKTIPYRAMFGSSHRRPSAKLLVEQHVEMGSLIKAVLHSDQRPYGVYRRLDKLRSTLEDWLALETPREALDGPDFFDVYYHDPDEGNPHAAAAASRSGVIDLLASLRAKLVAAYPDCGPLRVQLNRIDMSIKMVDRMKPVFPKRARRMSSAL